MAKPKTKTSTSTPVIPTLDDPLVEQPSVSGTPVPLTPYEQALAAGEELRRKPYAAAMGPE